MELLPVLAVALVAGLLLLASRVREARVRRIADRFAAAYLALAERLFADGAPQEAPAFETDGAGRPTLLPPEEQSAAIAALIRRAAEPETRELLYRMRDARDEAFRELSSINLIGKRFTAAFNRVYDLTEGALIALTDEPRLGGQQAYADLRYFLSEQEHLRSATLASIVSPASAAARAAKKIEVS